MATSRSNLRFEIAGGAEDDRAVAAIAALQMYLAQEEARVAGRATAADRWALAGRLEGQGIPVTRGALAGSWRFVS
jgi:hypothetical protein